MTMTQLSLSVLDQSVSLAGSTDGAAIRDTLDLAQYCEDLGYARFWVSEHHGLPSIVGSAPEILMAAIAARTTRIRIGSAGVICRTTARSRWPSSSACWKHSRPGASTLASAARRAATCAPRAP